MSQRSDEQLAQKAVSDPAALTELYERHVRRIYRYILARVGQVSDAQDLTAQTFTEMLRCIREYRGCGVFAAWLTVIARNVVVEHYRGQRANVPLDVVDDVADAVLIEEVVGRRLRLAQVRAALEDLPADYGEVIRLRFFGELSTTETAQAMGRSEAAVKMLLHRAMSALRQQLAEVDKV